MFPTTPTADDLAGMFWYNAASEDTRRFWHGIAGSAVPVDAWIAYRDTAGTICPSPAPQSPGESLAAPAAAGQGVSTSLHQFHDRDDGLLHCMVCNGAEGSLPIECPGRRMTDSEQDAVYAGQLDFFNGIWDRRA